LLRCTILRALGAKNKPEGHNPISLEIAYVPGRKPGAVPWFRKGNPMNAHVLADTLGDAPTVSDWVSVDQKMIDSFADCTNDHQWIHVDRARARDEGPFGSTVAHGFLTLSLLSSLSYDCGAWPERLGTIINYGLDRLRFLAPVKAASRVRLRAKLKDIEEKAPGRLLVRHHSEVEIEGEETPALVAETVNLLILDEAKA